jgi:hypothetical protein
MCFPSEPPAQENQPTSGDLEEINEHTSAQPTALYIFTHRRESYDIQTPEQQKHQRTDEGD